VHVEVCLTEYPQTRTVTDDKGHYKLGNVPVGEHGIKIIYEKADPDNPNNMERFEKTDSVKIERARSVVTKNVTVET